MIQRLYVNNYRCLSNFELSVKESSAIIVGLNGTGKTTVRKVLEILQSIARGKNRASEHIQSKDFAFFQYRLPIRIEIQALIDNKCYGYDLMIELPENFKEVRVLEEKFTIDGKTEYFRKLAEVHLSRENKDSQFVIDWHQIALPIIYATEKSPLQIFKDWLSRMVILSPNPNLIKGTSTGETFDLAVNGNNFPDWFSGLLSNYPASYSELDRFLKEVIPDFHDFQNETISKDYKELRVRFAPSEAVRKVAQGEKFIHDSIFSVDFEELSDGEKCFFICATVIAINKYYGPIFCYWDEPDNFLSISTVGLLISKLKESFAFSSKKSQILITSHNIEAIGRFSSESTYLFLRKNHLEPTQIRYLNDHPLDIDVVDALRLGEKYFK